MKLMKMELPYVIIRSSPSTPKYQAHRQAFDQWLARANTLLSEFPEVDAYQIRLHVSDQIQLLLNMNHVKVPARRISVTLRLPTCRINMFLQNFYS